MKATLQFELPEENEEFRMAMDASKIFSFLSDLDNELRSILKHGDKALFGEPFKSADDLAELLRRQISQFQI